MNRNRNRNINGNRNGTIIHDGTRPLDNDRINEVRDEFINTIITEWPVRIEYLGEVDPSEVDSSNYSIRPTGAEIRLEYHMFRLIETDTIICHRWRLNELPVRAI